MSKHTQGEWYSRENLITDEDGFKRHGSIDIYAKDEDGYETWIASVHACHVGPKTMKETKANVDLILSAKAMLGALEWIVGNPGDKPAMDNCRAVMNKAKGIL